MAAKHTWTKVCRASSIQSKHNRVSGQHQCLFEESGDLGGVVSSNYEESVQGFISK